MKNVTYRTMEIQDGGLNVELELTRLNFQPGKFWLLPQLPHQQGTSILRILYVASEGPA